MTLASDLKPGTAYQFTTKDWYSPENELIRGEKKERRFIQHVTVSSVSFVEVARSDGTSHLIACETIESICPAGGAGA